MAENQLKGHKLSLTPFPRWMTKRHMFSLTLSNTVWSSLQWQWTDGKQAHEVLGSKKENLIWCCKLQRAERTHTWMSTALKVGWSSLSRSLLLGHCWVLLLSACSLHEATAIPKASHSLHKQTPTHQLTNQPPFYNRHISYPRAMNGSVISNQSSTSVQQKVLDIILEFDVTRADREVYALTTIRFLSFETEIYDRR